MRISDRGTSHRCSVVRPTWPDRAQEWNTKGAPSVRARASSSKRRWGGLDVRVVVRVRVRVGVVVRGGWGVQCGGEGGVGCAVWW